MKRPGFELTHQKLDAYVPANQVVLINLYRNLQFSFALNKCLFVASRTSPPNRSTHARLRCSRLLTLVQLFSENDSLTKRCLGSLKKLTSKLCISPAEIA